MRIATWNLDRPTAIDSAKGRRLMDHIREINADIWILTETHTAMSPGPGFEMNATEQRATTESGMEVWTAVWSRYPILRKEPVCDPFRAVCTQVDTPLGPLLVYGTVLPSQ